MFATVNVSAQPSTPQMNLFSEQPQNESISSSEVPLPPLANNGFPLNMDMNMGGVNANNFATGIGFQPESISSKAFVTGVQGIKPLDMSLFSKKQP